MSLPLPDPIASYFRAQNTHDVAGMLGVFASAARVHDEGRDREGRDAIRAWIDDTTRRYRPSATPLDVEQAGGQTIVKARVAGTFPGSPIERLSVHDRRRLIAALAIG